MPSTKRLSLLLSSLFLSSLAFVACKSKSQSGSLLCTQDSDCRKEGGTAKCEAVSGLCVPFYENPNNPDGRSDFESTGDGEGGVRGAFDCAVDWTADFQTIGKQYKIPQSQGLATVFVSSPRLVDTCGPEQTRQKEDTPENRFISGLRAGCSVRLATRERRDKDDGSTGKVIQLGFSQYTESPDIPVAGFRINFRPSWISTAEDLAEGEIITLEPSKVSGGELISEGQLTGRYFELCENNDFATTMNAMSGSRGEDGEASLRLRFVATNGSLVITDYIPSQGDDAENFVPGRLKGYFDLKLQETQSTRSKPVGQECIVPTDCGDENGCLDNEVTTPECYAGECQPLTDPESLAVGLGFCGGRCKDAQDCGYHPTINPSAYCLILPGKKATDGQCIQACSPTLSRDICSQGTTCRPGSDFQKEFGGQGGPARCLDRCIPSASHTIPADCPTRMSNQNDAGMGPRPDGGMMSRPDAGMTSRPDSGMMNPSDAGGLPPPDASMPAADAGFGMDAAMPGSSVLGQPCSSSSPCPMTWLCAVQPTATVDSNTVGYCSKPCAMSAECSSGYTGPGQASCGPPAKFIAQNGSTMIRPSTCAVVCGASLLPTGVTPEMCPGQMSCGDIVNNSMPMVFGPMPSPDGMNDYCVD